MWDQRTCLPILAAGMLSHFTLNKLLLRVQEKGDRTKAIYTAIALATNSFDAAHRADSLGTRPR